MYLPEAAQIREFLNRELQKSFKPSLVDIKDRVRLIPDLEKYRLEDPYFTAQAKGMIPKHYSIYFDDEYVCGFDSTYLPEAIMLVFWRGLKKLYGEHKIYFDKSLYKAEEDMIKYEAQKAEKERQAKFDKLPNEAKQVIKTLVERNKRKKKK